jgi:hypothetical protein
MDMGGHQRFKVGTAAVVRESAGTRAGMALLTAAWSALASSRVESVSIHLRSGPVIEGVLRLRMDGPIAEAATRSGHYSHAFAVADVAMIRNVARGGSF